MRRKVYLLLLLLCLLMSGRPAAAQGLDSAAEPVNTVKEGVQNGWDDTMYYYDGQPVTGLQNIDGKFYFFDQNGHQQTGWQQIEKKIYYFNKKDAGAASVGRVRISGKYYCFNDNGVMKTGWTKINGKRFYFRPTGKLGTIGSSYEGLQKIKGKYYYFKASGAVTTGWVTFKKGKSYFNSKGERVTGARKIKKRWYFFNKNGIRQTKTVKEGGVTYYLNAKGYLEAYKKKSKYYKPNGTAMSKVEKEDYLTLQRARKIVAEITTSKMSKKEKLAKCFAWVMKKPYVMRRQFSSKEGWPAVYANDHFQKGGGDCHADGSAFAYLARALGYTNVYVCLDTTTKNSRSSHCWTEIDGLVYDPLFAQAKSYSKNYGSTYKVFGLSAITRVRVAVGY